MKDPIITAKPIPPFAALACFTAMVGLRTAAPGFMIVPSALGLLGIVPIAAGAVLCLEAATRFRRTQTNLSPFRNPNRLETGGVFSMSRNPMYLGLILMLLGVAWWLGAAMSFLPVIAFFGLAQFGTFQWRNERCRTHSAMSTRRIAIACADGSDGKRTGLDRALALVRQNP